MQRDQRAFGLPDNMPAGQMPRENCRQYVVTGRPTARLPALAGSSDVIAAIEKLGDLRSKGILTDEEFAKKKAELLARL